MIRRPYHRKRLADLKDLARSRVKSGAVINAKLAGCSQGRFSQSGRSLLESGNFPFVCIFQIGSSNPLNLDVEWQPTHLDGSRRRLVGPFHKVIHVSTHSNEEIEKTRTPMSAWFPYPYLGLELTIYFHQAPFPSAL